MTDSIETRTPINTNEVPVQFSNILLVLAYFTPLLISILIFFLGIVGDQLIQVSIFMAGLLLCQFMIQFFSFLPNPITKDFISRQLNRQECNIFAKASTIFMTGDVVIPPSITMIFYTLSFAMASMIISENINMPLLFFLLTLTMNHIYHMMFQKKCSWGMSLLGGIFGMAISSLIVLGLMVSNKKELLLFSNTLPSTNTQCSKVSGKKYKCSIYKDGQIVRNM